MIFTELTLKNFFRYGNNEQTFQLNRNGIWNITGLNGYGKSTIIEAIVWCLFGKTRQEKVEDVVNRKTKKDCKVSVSFTDEKNTYKVIRYRQHTLHKNNVLIFINDEDKTPHTASEANQMIQEILGFNYITFVNSSIFSSTLYKKFLDADNKDRLIVMENLLDLKQITAFYAKTKDLIKETKDSYEEVNLDFTSKHSDLNSLKNSLLQYKENAKEKLVSLKLEKKRLEEEKENLISEKEKLLSIDIEKEKKILTDKEYINSLKKEYDEKRKNLKPEEKPSNEAIDFVDKYSGVNFEEEIEKEKRAEVLLKKQEELNSLIKEKNFEIKKIQLDLSNKESKRVLLEKEIEELEKKLEETSSGFCPTCHQVINKEEIEKQKAEYNYNIQQKKSDISSIETNELLTKEKELEDEVSSLKKEYSEINIETYIKNASILKEKYEKFYSEIENIKAKNIVISESNEIIYSALSKMKEEIDKFNGVSESSWTLEELNNISSKIEEINNKIKECELKAASILGSVSTVYDKSFVEKTEKEIEEKNEILLKIQKDKEALEEDIKYFNYLADCFSNKSNGFKKYFIGEMIDTFNSNINKFIPFFFNNEALEIKFDKDLNDSITMDNEEITYGSLSKGQKTRAELAIAFALFELSRFYYSNCNNILMVDEMLDDGLDIYGMRSAISVLKGFSDSTVYVISHNDNIKELIENKIEITKDENGFSVIKE